MNRIKVIADDKIPFLKGVIEDYVDISYLSPTKITNETVKDADALLIRTRTKCNAQLLDYTSVKFIATATIGYDHIDTSYCDSNGIRWLNAPGCNSGSVQQYIASVIFTLAEKHNFSLKQKTIGIVGVGNVGSKVEKIARVFGMKVLLNDPPRERKEGSGKFVSLDKLVEEADIITLHVPLNKSGIDKTFHLAGDQFFEKIKKGKILINSSRGEVIETRAIKKAIRDGRIGASVFDVWENEPYVDQELLNMTDVGTPHIAGYSADGKANGTATCVNALNEYFRLGMKEKWYPAQIPDSKKPKQVHIDGTGKSKEEILHECILSTYNVLDDNERLKNSVETFEKQRGDYPVRREFPFFYIHLQNGDVTTQEALINLGFNLVL
jgi:erythronate-4-phosphate dehydrogenase